MPYSIYILLRDIHFEPVEETESAFHMQSRFLLFKARRETRREMKVRYLRTAVYYGGMLVVGSINQQWTGMIGSNLIGVQIVQRIFVHYYLHKIEVPLYLIYPLNAERVSRLVLNHLPPNERTVKMDSFDELSDGEPPTIDPYEVLGLDRSATADQVKSAYRKAALKSHPGR